MKTTTSAYNRFELLIKRTENLIKLGAIGIDQETEELDVLLEQFVNVKGISGRNPKAYLPEVDVKNLDDDGNMQLTVDARSAFVIKTMLKQNRLNTSELHNHLFSIYSVYVWGAFETYLEMVFEELFEDRPEMLKSNKMATYSDIVENQKNVISLLIDKELDEMGHFSFNEYINYLSDKINFEFDENEASKLQDIYFVRNIIAHNTGIVSSRHKNKIPNNLKIKGLELLISKKYLTTSISTLKGTIKKIENHIQRKFYKT